MWFARRHPDLAVKAIAQSTVGPSRRNVFMEPIYQTLFKRELERHRIEDNFFPTNHGANYGLLYSILRICTELPVRSVVELGCGQTSLLLDGLRRQGALDRVVGVEHAPAWVARVAAQVSHEVVHVPLVANGSRRGAFYDGTVLAGLGRFDLIIVDGPPDAVARGRVGLLDVAASLLQQDAAIIIDDIQRWREELMSKTLLRSLLAQQRAVSWQTVSASKKQAILLVGRFAEALWL